MYRKVLVGLAMATILAGTGCNSCRWCAGHPWFSRNRQCCPPATAPCNGCPPAAVPAVPNAPAVPPATSGFGPTPNVIVPPSSPAGY